MSKGPRFQPLVPKGGVPKGHRPLLMAKMDTANTGGRIAIKDQIYNYLKRLRWTIPFPLDPIECYLACVPNAIREWRAAHVFDGLQPQSGRVLNLMNSINIRNEQNVIHFSLDSLDKFVRECGTRSMGHELVFWMQMGENLPAAMDTKNVPMFVPEDHPNRDVLRRWHKAADRLEEDIHQMLKTITQYSRLIDTAPGIKHTWPDLLNFVNVRSEHMSAAVREELKVHAAKVMAPTDKAHIIHQLSTAVMIPETAQHSMKAWPGYYLNEYNLDA